jgi:RNA polymerase sigma-70 factor (ECF subfamily)
LVVWRRFPQYELGTNFTAWACSIAHYQVLSNRQRRGRSRVCFSDALVAQLAACEAEAAAGPAVRIQRRLRQRARAGHQRLGRAKVEK